jgi:hypothetical protein
MIDGTEHSLAILVFAYSGRADCMAPDSGSRLHMEPCGPAAVLFVYNGHGHGHRKPRRSCWVHSLPVLGVWAQDHNKTAVGVDQAGAPPASTPLQSPHFLVVVKRADCAVYRTKSGLCPALYAVGKYVDEEN